MKKFFSVVLVLTLLFSVIGITPIAALATENTSTISIAEKTSSAIDENGHFEVKIQVPGGDGTNYHDEVIIMVDGSYSTDDDWSITRNAILEVGKTVLEGNGNTQLTVMTFGMGDNVVVQNIVSVADLDTTLTELPGGLLYGRSSTNCEAGFTGIEEYIESQGNTLNDAYVVYITDGEINTDETEYIFYNWTENTWLKRSTDILIKWSIAEECAYYSAGETVLSNAYTSVFGDTIYTPEEVETDGIISEEDAMDWANQVWADVYAYNGMNPETAYPVSDTERAFVKYDKEHNTHIQEMFYYTLWGRSYPDRYTRTPAAGIELAANEKVANLYMVDSNGATSWMTDMANSADNVSFYEAGSVDNLLTTLEGIITDLSFTPYNDVIITDYMSKWVNLDTSTIKIVDNYSGQTIWTNVDGWLIDENRPTSQEIPVVVEEVSANEYAQGGFDVIGNTSGTIYKLTWYVKDGAMLRNHNYSLVYEVNVDTEERGFRYGTSYPANGNTTINYTEKSGDEITEEIESITVPNVVVAKPECDKKPETNKPNCDKKPETSKPDCDKKPETNKPDCDKKPETNKPNCDKKPETNKPDCDKKPETNKSDCDKKPETNKSECDKKPETNKPDCDKKPETNKSDCDKKPETNKSECDKKPETNKSECDKKPETNKSDCDKKTETNKPECCEKSETNKPECSEKNETDKTECDKKAETEKTDCNKKIENNNSNCNTQPENNRCDN